MTDWFKPVATVLEEKEQKVFTYNEVMAMLRKHRDNHKKRYEVGTQEYQNVMRFHDPLQDDFCRTYMGKPSIQFDENGFQIRD
jgi:hypothetical protein